jgi:signal transduction histidine kinase
MSIKAKQVAGVTSLVVVVVAILSAYHLSTMSAFLLEETASRAELMSRALFQRTLEVVREHPNDAYPALQADGGIRAILDASIGYSDYVNYAAIADPAGIAVAHAFPTREGAPLDEQPDFDKVVKAGPVDRLLTVFYADQGYEVRQPLLAGDKEFGSIRIGVSTLLVRRELRSALGRAISIVLGTLLISSLMAMLLSQWLLRPIHVIQSSLSRLGRGELDVRLDLPEQEFKDLGSSFDAVTAQLAALGRGGDGKAENTLRSGVGADYESVMENLEDAVALFSTRGEVIFSNAAMRALRFTELPESHPARQLVARTLATRHSAGPISIAARVSTGESSADLNLAALRDAAAAGEPDNDSERLLMCHAIEDTARRFLGAMLVARNVGYLNQVHSTLNYSRKAAAIGRLLAGVAHEVKNPLNAMTIHLELLKQKVGSIKEPIVVPGPAGGPPRQLDLAKHVSIIAAEIKRLDEVVAGFLKFARPEELRLQPVLLATVIHDVALTITPEAQRRRVTLREECGSELPAINADQGMLMQAVLNLAINALQAMPEGGSLRLSCRRASRRRVALVVEDTGVGIPPENLPRIFDLYFTTKEKGSGIGLSMVFRIVQLHDGEVEVQSIPGGGTKFTLFFPQAISQEPARQYGRPMEATR